MNHNPVNPDLVFSALPTDPIPVIARWLAEAKQTEINDPDAMSLATADKDGRVHNRMVLLKDISESSLTFFTNAHSDKGRELKENPHVALCLHWKSLRRQIRIEGVVSVLDDQLSDDYFASRSRDSQLGAWASDQSKAYGERVEFEQRLQEVTQKYQGQTIPRPPHWHGFSVAPDRIEFWQDRPHRLHDRLVYIKAGEAWKIERLYP